MGAVAGGVAALLSLMVLSRAVADNPAYRFAQYLLVGVALGYVAAVLVNQTLVPPILQAATTQVPFETWIVLGSAAALLVLLATRFGRQRASYLANVPLAVLFGVGGAVALGGALRGTLVPQLLDTIALRRLQTTEAFARAGTLVLIGAVVITLLSFTYARAAEQPSSLSRGVYGLGRSLILATFGVFFAAAVTTYITALVTQLQAILDWLTQIGILS